MENLLCIKGKIIGKGKPLVCVPVMESSKEEILRETRRLEEAHTEMIEWRVDAFENVESPNAIREILNEMKHIIKESILVYTFRSKIREGAKHFPRRIFMIFIRWRQNQMSWILLMWNILKQKSAERNSHVAGDGSICDCFPS